jgi:hypothetical protein
LAWISAMRASLSAAFAAICSSAFAWRPPAGLDLGAGFLGDALRLGAGIGECLVVGFFRLDGLTLQVLGGGKVVGQRPLAFGQNGRDPRQATLSRMK